MRVQREAEYRWTLHDLPEAPWRVAAALRSLNLAGVTDVVPAIATVGVYGGPETDEQALARELPLDDIVQTREHHLLIDFGQALDLVAASEALRLEPEAIISALLQTTFRCAAVGFQPGFPYLLGLPERLCGLPRRPEPRLRVPAGSFAITGSQAGIYAQESPGGWWLLGRCYETLVDVSQGFFLIEPGDLVRLKNATQSQ